MDQGQFENYPLQYKTYSTVASNGGNNVVYTGAGFLKRVIFSQADAAPTAGTITIYDNTSIYGTTDTRLFSHTQTTGVFMPTSVDLDVPFTTGLSIGFTSTNDVNVILVFKAGA